MSKNGNHHSLSLADARERTPAVNPVEAMRRQILVAVAQSVQPEDVVGVLNTLRERALGGDLKAMKMYLEFTMPKQASPAPAEAAGLKLMAEALTDLVDEIRINKAHAVKREQIGAATKNGDDS